MRNKTHILIAFILQSTLSWAQVPIKIERKTNFNTYIGKENYTAIIRDSIHIKTGNYVFTSNLPIKLIDNTIFIHELSINGQYLKNQKNGQWKYLYQSFSIADLALKGVQQILLQHKINGNEDEYTFTFKNGNRYGKSIYNQRRIENGKYGIAEKLAEIPYQNDTIKGEFMVNIDSIKINGTTNNEGFLIGKLELLYFENQNQILEKRGYKNGFLISLEKLNPITNEVITKIELNDVVNVLERIEKGDKNIGFEISEQYFGLKFNPGYQQSDNRITEQLYGNSVLRKYLNLFDSIYNLNTQTESKASILKFTRRFKYFYPPEDDSISNYLSKLNLTLNRKIETVLKAPNIILRKNNSDSLLGQYQILLHIKSKSDTIQKVLDKINSGYFSHRLRHNYYLDGIPGLNAQENIFYQFNGQSIQIPFKLNQIITHSDSLLYQLLSYFNSLNENSQIVISKLNQSVSVFENQEKIDSLDNIITNLEDLLHANYPKTILYTSENISKAPFSYKLYFSLNDGFLTQLKSKYINNLLPQQEIILAGNILICTYKFLLENKQYLDNIQKMKDYWNDSLFTLYLENPFDFRKLETSILPGVQHAANILLKQYANQLLNAKNCTQIESELKKVKLLNERIKFLVRNQHIENVQQLNKALKRERVPGRIERLLEL